jgi:adenosylhomocysteine nucleosidase
LTSIGLVVALPHEMPARFVRVAVCQGSGEGSWPLYRRTCGTSQMTAVQSGIGCQRAAAAARLLVHRFAPQVLVSFGFAGGLLPEIAPGTLIIGAKLVHAAGSRDPPLDADDALVEQFVAAARREGLAVRHGTMITTPHLMADIPSKAALARTSGACAVDMETAGIAAVARQAGLAWVAIRAVVDTAEETLPTACLHTVKADGRLALGPFMRTLCRSPGVLRQFFWLGRRAKTARQHLSRVLERWDRDQQPPCSRGQG